MCSAYTSSAVGLKEVLIAGGFIGLPLIAVGFIAGIRGWCASEPVRFVAAPAIGDSREMVFGLLVDAEGVMGPGITKHALEIMGYKAINTGCATLLWMLTPERCAMIPSQKAENAIISISGYENQANPKQDQKMINYIGTRLRCGVAAGWAILIYR